MPRLPPEVISDYIIDSLHDSPRDLHACALVCKEWLEYSRFHIFYRISIEVHERPCDTPCYHRLDELIQRSPHIALYVRELRFWYGSGWEFLLRTDPVLAQLLRSFTQLCKLELYAVHWTLLIPDVRTSLRHILALPSLTDFEAHLDFSRLEHLTGLIHSHLKHLFTTFRKTTIRRSLTDRGATIEEIRALKRAYREVDEEDGLEAILEQKPCRLEYLGWDLTFGSDFLDWLLASPSIVDLSGLRTLIVSVNENSGPKWMRLVRSLGSLLEHLTLDLSEFDASESSFDSIDIGPQPNLRSLSLTVKFSSIAARCLTDLFSNLVPSNLQRLSFDISVFQGYFDEDEVWTCWMRVGCALERHPLGQLRSMKVFVSPGYNNKGRYRQNLDGIFPSLAARGIMVLEFF